MSAELQGSQPGPEIPALETPSTSTRLPLSQRHFRKTPGQMRHSGFLLAVWLHVLLLGPPYLSQRYLHWPGFNLLTWSGLLEWVYILPAFFWLRRRHQPERALGLMMNAVGLFAVYAFLTAVGWATG